MVCRFAPRHERTNDSHIRSDAVGRFRGPSPPKNSFFRPPVTAKPPRVGGKEASRGLRPRNPAKTPTTQIPTYIKEQYHSAAEYSGVGDRTGICRQKP